MPYIPKSEREKYDQIVNELANVLNTQACHTTFSGELNYVLFRLARLLCDSKSGGKRQYARMAMVLSAMTEAQVEFRRRVLAPYEDEVTIKNGDIEP